RFSPDAPDGCRSRVCSLRSTRALERSPASTILRPNRTRSKAASFCTGCADPESPRLPAMSAGDDAVLAALDFPPPHLLRFGASTLRRGMVLDPHGRVARSLRVRVDGESVGDFPADHPSEDVATHLPQLSAARTCRCDFELWIPESAGVI